MHTLNPTNRLLTHAILAVVAGAIMMSSLHQRRVVYGRRSVAEVIGDFAPAQTGVHGHFTSSWQLLKNKTEVQIRDNDKRISMFKAQRAKASSTFRATYDKRVAELERRNLALKGELNDYKGDKGGVWVEFK